MPLKPWAELDESELKAEYLEAARKIEAGKQALREYGIAVRNKHKAATLLKERFAIDPKTGRRVRKVRDLLSRVG